MRRGQDPFVENSESIAQIGLKMPLEIEWNRQKREVLRSAQRAALAAAAHSRAPPQLTSSRGRLFCPVWAFRR